MYNVFVSPSLLSIAHVIHYNALMRTKIGLLGAFIGVVAIIGLHLVDSGAKKANAGYTGAVAPDMRDWTEVFSDNFSGSKLDGTKWTTCYDWRLPTEDGCTNAGNYEQEWYMPQQVSIRDGAAIITASNSPVVAQAKNGRTTYSYRSGMISTGRPDTQRGVLWSATYGLYEARLKFDGGQGVWPAFWLLPTDRSWPPEIDAMEFLGNDPSHVLLTSHWKNAAGRPQKDSSTIAGPDFTVGWHTYAVNWQPDSVKWYIDGVLKKTVTGIAVPHVPMEIILDLAIGGMLPGNADASTPFPRTLQIDYVRVYELRK